jgi:hypothetical protein
MVIHNLSLIFGSKTKAQEILFLIHEKKKVVRHGFYENELPSIERFCEKNGLIMVKSKFKVLLADETSYSNRGIRIQGTDPRPGMYFVYISKDEKQAWLASYYELMNNNYDLGKLLGYPHCCVDFFCKRFSDNNPNLELKPTNFFTNLTKRNNDNVLLSHFPCSSNCEDSINVAKKYLDIIMKVDSGRAEELITSLKL